MTGSQTDHSAMGAIAVVTPVLNDWASLERLVGELDRLPALAGRRLAVFAVDDGSFPSPPIERLAQAPTGAGAVTGVSVIRLAANLGHQRAIAVGLVEVSKRPEFDRVLVMDADGEDRPEDVAALISAENGQVIVLALRARRSEGFGFRLGYRIYQLLFRALTGNAIRFGNFCLIPGAFVGALTHSPATWNNLAAAIMRSRLPTVSVPTPRGGRYAGRSKMNLLSLAMHGLSAISVYIDVMLVRIICAALIAGALVTAALIAVVFLKLSTRLAIPGWASFIGVSLLVLLFQVLMFASIALFQFLSLRSTPMAAPATQAPPLVAEVIEAGPLRSDEP